MIKCSVLTPIDTPAVSLNNHGFVGVCPRSGIDGRPAFHGSCTWPVDALVES